MRRWNPLNERQLSLLRRIGEGGDAVRFSDPGLAVSVYALRARGLVITAACIELPGHGTAAEATIQFLAENRDMAAIAGLMAQDGGPAPVDMHA